VISSAVYWKYCICILLDGPVGHLKNSTSKGTGTTAATTESSSTPTRKSSATGFGSVGRDWS
jgi:hypothetical protein